MRAANMMEYMKATSYDCARNLHSFLRWRPRGESYRSKGYRGCGAELIDWNRLDQRDLDDVEYTVASLLQELIRHEYWHRPVDEKAIRHASKKGMDALREGAVHRLRKYVGRPRSELSRDGMQTPFSGNVIYYAQHATATCCRKCIEAWHGIGRECHLTEEEIAYFAELMMHYIETRLAEPSAHTMLTSRGSGTVVKSKEARQARK